MKLGFVGLGKMGSNMVLHILGKGHNVAVYNRSPEPAVALAKQGAKRAESLAQLCQMLPKPRIIWLMVSAGKPVDDVLAQLLPSLSPGDIVIDGGNSNYIDSVRRFKWLAKHKIHFLDVGTSGGLEGARNGACLTIGGEKKTYMRLQKLFASIACPGGYLYVGPAGAGNYVKTVHNGMEYAMLQALGEGFAVLERAPYELELDKIADVWQHGSVIRSWLLSLAGSALAKDKRLEKIQGSVGGGETGRWAIAQAKKAGVRVPSMELALRERVKSAKSPSFSGRVIAAVRHEFGGHEVKKARK